MLNWIWAGLIITSLLFAGFSDFSDISRDKYRNGASLPVELTFPAGYDRAARSQPVAIHIDPAQYGQLYATEDAPAETYEGTLVQTEEGQQVRFAADASFPEPLATIAGVSKSNDDELQGTVGDFAPGPVAPVVPSPPAPATDSSGALLPDSAAAAPIPTEPGYRASLAFAPVRFVKMTAVSQAALDFAETAATLALGLIGALALFLGMLQIAEASGIVFAVVKFVRPVLRPLFPEIPPDHPALGMIALNIAANMFGLGNAATPFGIKAMEELQKLNSTEDTATNSMVMLLAINTASVQLMPPVLLLALMGLQINQLIFPILITTGLGLVVAIIAAKTLAKLPVFARTDPARLPPPPPAAAATPMGGI
jgi:spore maturation protein A